MGFRFFKTTSAEETQELAKQLLPQMLNKKIVLLFGQLGSGKTTFVKGIAKALGIQKTVKSPTYTYVNKYEIRNSKNQLKTKSYKLKALYHFDLYRLPEKSENQVRVMAEIGLAEALEKLNAIVVVEWAQRLSITLPALRLTFEKKEDHYRIHLMKQP